MVKILGIIAVLYVCYGEINAADMLEFWQPTKEYWNTRRMGVVYKNNHEGPHFRQEDTNKDTNKDTNTDTNKDITKPDKSRGAIREVKQYIKSSKSHIESLRQHEDGNRHKIKNKKHNTGKIHNRDSEHSIKNHADTKKHHKLRTGSSKIKKNKVVRTSDKDVDYDTSVEKQNLHDLEMSPFITIIKTVSEENKQHDIEKTPNVMKEHDPENISDVNDQHDVGQSADMKHHHHAEKSSDKKKQYDAETDSDEKTLYDEEKDSDEKTLHDAEKDSVEKMLHDADKDSVEKMLYDTEKDSIEKILHDAEKDSDEKTLDYAEKRPIDMEKNRIVKVGPQRLEGIDLSKEQNQELEKIKQLLQENNQMKDRNYNTLKNDDSDSEFESNNEFDPDKKEAPIINQNNPFKQGVKRDKNKDKILGKDAKIKESAFEPLMEHSVPKLSKKHHRSKLRNQNGEDEHIKSTRLIPMHLMQQDEETTTKKDTSTVASTLSPYSVLAQMKQILEEYLHVNATFEVIARTVEYKDIVLIKLTEKKLLSEGYFRAKESKYIDEAPEKRIIFIVHGLTVIGVQSLESLSEIASLNTLIGYYLRHLDKFDIYLMPMANPDGWGAQYTAGFWNKNLSPQEACRGVNVDRNFDVAWNSSRKLSSCSQLYPGPSPFSEVESRAVRDVFHYHSHKILAYIHVHPGTPNAKIYKGDAVLYPRGYSESQSDDDKYIDLKGEIDEAMKNASFQVMSVTVDTLFNWYGKTTGSSVDYAATVYGIPYALEFVMQLYAEDERHPYGHLALKEIWSRVIETTFNNLWKSLHGNEVRKK